MVNASLQDDSFLERDWTGTSLGCSESNLGFPPDYDIRRELYQVKANLRRVRQERDEAVALNACYQNEVALLESQLQEAKDRLLAVEMAYGDEAQWNINILGEESRVDEWRLEEADETLFSEDDSLDADLGMNDWAIEHPDIQTDGSSNASGSDSDDFELFQQQHLITQEDENLSEDDSSSDALQNRTSRILDVYSSDSSVDSSIDSSIDSTSSLSCFSLSIGDWAGDQFDDSSSSSPARPTPLNGELRRTKKLMASAHKEGNTTALIKTRKLIAESERTPRHERTEAQRYLLLNWRSPSWSSRNNYSSLVPVQYQPAPAAYYPSSSNERLEIYVDASGWGIGFVFGAQWLAWTFKKTLQIPLGGDGRMVMHWAELLAVEVGLRAMIAAGHRSTTITVYSDNTGVIDALNKRSWCPQHGLEDSLRIILNLCGDNRIELRPLWVSTNDNLADMPSRGEFPRSPPFEYVPNLTKRLSDLLELAVPLTA